MSLRNQNPFAFPQPLSRTDSGQMTAPCDQHPDYAGMEMRDYFAAAALAGVLQARATLARDGLYGGEDLNQQSIAEECYELADAMLDARTKAKDAS